MRGTDNLIVEDGRAYLKGLAQRFPDSQHRRSKPIRVTVGCDPEFEVINRYGEVIRAGPDLMGSRIGREGLGSNLPMGIGVDGSGDQLELRPRASSRPRSVVSNIKQLFETFEKNYGRYGNRGLGLRVSIKGDSFPLGGHIHIGVGLEWMPPQRLVKMLDHFIGDKYRRVTGEARQEGEYGSLGDAREKPHGFEYRTPSSTVFGDPKIAYITMKLAKNVTETFLNRRDISFELPPSKKDYIKIGGLTEEEFYYFYDYRQLYEEMEEEDYHRVTTNWVPDVRPPKKYNPMIDKVIFSDEWHVEDIKDNLHGKLAAELKKLKKRVDKQFNSDIPIEGIPTVVLYGLAEHRGFSCTLPVEGMEHLPEPRPKRTISYTTSCGNGFPHTVKIRRLYVGLPYGFRNNSPLCHWEELTDNLVKSIIQMVELCVLNPGQFVHWDDTVDPNPNEETNSGLDEHERELFEDMLSPITPREDS